jgi:hypothetical protein
MPPHFGIVRWFGADAIIVDLTDEYHFLTATDWILWRLNPDWDTKFSNVIFGGLADHFPGAVRLNLKVTVFKVIDPLDRRGGMLMAQHEHDSQHSQIACLPKPASMAPKKLNSFRPCHPTPFILTYQMPGYGN